MPAPIRKQTRNMHLVALHNSTNDTPLLDPRSLPHSFFLTPSLLSLWLSMCMLSLRKQQQAFLIMLQNNLPSFALPGKSCAMSQTHPDPFSNNSLAEGNN